jgi:hypothetical protein
VCVCVCVGGGGITKAPVHVVSSPCCLSSYAWPLRSSREKRSRWGGVRVRAP